MGEGEQDLVSVAGLCRRVADPKPQLAGVAAGLKKASECGFAGVPPAVFESFGGGCAGRAGEAPAGGPVRLLTGSCLAGWALDGGGAVLGRGRRRWGEGEAARGRAGRRRGRASERGRRCCK